MLRHQYDLIQDTNATSVVGGGRRIGMNDIIQNARNIIRQVPIDAFHSQISNFLGMHFNSQMTDIKIRQRQISIPILRKG